MQERKKPATKYIQISMTNIVKTISFFFKKNSKTLKKPQMIYSSYHWVNGRVHQHKFDTFKVWVSVKHIMVVVIICDRSPAPFSHAWLSSCHLDIPNVNCMPQIQGFKALWKMPQQIWLLSWSPINQLFLAGTTWSIHILPDQIGYVITIILLLYYI